MASLGLPRPMESLPQSCGFRAVWMCSNELSTLPSIGC